MFPFRHHTAISSPGFSELLLSLDGEQKSRKGRKGEREREISRRERERAMVMSESYVMGKTAVHLEASRILAPQAQPHVDFRIRFTGFDSSVNDELSYLYEAVHRFHLGQIPLPSALPTIVSSVVAYLHNLHVDLRGLCIPTLLSFSSLAAAEIQRMGGSALELLVHVGQLLKPGGSDEEVDLMLDCIMETRPPEEDMADAVYDYYLDQVFGVRHGGFGGVPASRSFIQRLQRSSYGRGEDLREKEYVICLEEFDAQAEVSKMPCSHVFHSQCIIQWLEKSHLCPICRYQLPTASSHSQDHPSLLNGPSASQNRMSGTGGHL